MSSIFHRFPADPPPLALRGEGVYLYDAAGKAYLDGSGGAAVSILGHGHPRVRRAMHEQIDRLAFAHTLFFSNEPSEALAEMLVGDAPAGLERVYFLSGGSEATEAALKLARQYHVARGQQDRRIFIHRRQSYHGNTLGALAVGGNRARRTLYEPILLPAGEIAPCYAYRHRRADETEQAYGLRCADELETEIARHGPGRVAAFIAETVVGATLGAVPAVAGYFRRIRETCDRHGVLLILDEVMCGMGRTGTLYAASAEGVVPDILTIAKGLGGGYQPIGAMLVHRDVYAEVCGNGGYFHHGHTYIGHAVACAAGLAVQQALREEGLLERVRPLGEKLMAELAGRFGDHPNVGDIRGRGLLIGLELVADRATKQPFEPGRGLASAIRRKAMQHGLICYPGAGTADGIAGDHVLLAPPYIFEDRHIDELMEKLDATFAVVLPR